MKKKTEENSRENMEDAEKEQKSCKLRGRRTIEGKARELNCAWEKEEESSTFFIA